MIEAEVLILAAISTLFVLGWSVLGAVDAFRRGKPQSSPNVEQPMQARSELTPQR